MKENKYDDSVFFEQYSHMPRSEQGLSAAGEWPALKALLPELAGKRVLDLGCGFGWHCRYAAEHGAARVLGTDLSQRMLERARAHRDSHTYVAENMEQLEETLNTKPGFVKAMWCGCLECEEKIKEVAGATSRCIPFEQEKLSDQCVCCGKPAKKMVYWGKAY